MLVRTKKIIFLCVALFLLSIAIFPRHYLLTAIKWEVKRHAKNAFGAEVVFKKVSMIGSKLHFEDVKLYVKKETFASFSATFEPKIRWFQMQLGGDIFLEDLKIVCSKYEKKFFRKRKMNKSRFLSWDFQVAASQGELLLYNYLDASAFYHRFLFDLNHRFSSEKNSGEITFCEDSQLNEKCSFRFRQEDGHAIFTGNFEKYTLHPVQSLFNFFIDTKGPIKDWTCFQGTIDGAVELSLKDYALEKLKTDIILSGIQAENNLLGISAHIEKTEAKIDSDFSSVSKLNGALQIEGGKVALKEKSAYQGIWDLKDLHSKICIKDGKLESSIVHAQFLGMQGQLILDWKSDILMHMGFCGLSKEMQSLLPEALQQGFQKAFPNDYFVMDANVRKAKNGLELTGFLSMYDEENNNHRLDFGCNLGPEGKSPETAALESLPFSLSRSVSQFFEEVKEQFFLSEQRIGWFKGKALPLEKFLSPFLFGDAQMELQGLADLEATFDEKYLVFFFEGKNFNLDCPYFQLSADTAVEKENSVAAVYCIDLENFSRVGFLPLRNARYFQKNYGLVFERANALLQFENEKIKAKEITAYWNDICFHGKIDLAIRSLSDIDCRISSEDFSGPLPNAQKLIAHFVPSKVWEIPFHEGIVKGSFDFNYHFSPKATLLEGVMNGHLEGCALQTGVFNIAGGETDFEYSFKNNRAALKNGFGNFLLPMKEKTFSFILPSAEFYDFPNFQTSFYLEGSENEQQVLTLKGTSSQSDEGRKFILEGAPFNLEGIQIGEKFAVNAFSYRDWKGQASLKIADEIEIEEFLCSKAADFDMKFSGKLQKKEKRLLGQIEKLHCNLEDPFAQKLSVWKPKGEIALSGLLDWQLGQSLEVRGKATFNGLEFGGIHFGSGDHLRCYYSSCHGLAVEGLEAEIPSEKGTEKYKLGRFLYDHTSQKVHLEGFDFSLPCEKLSDAAKKIDQLFPGKVHASVLEALHTIKQKEPFEGRISVEIHPESLWIYLNLKDGIYFIDGKEVDLSDFLLVYDPLELNVWTNCHYEGAKYWLHFNTDSMTMTHGKASISEKPLSMDLPENFETMHIKWEAQKNKGWHIRHVEGYFSGVEVALESPKKMEPSEWISLKGSVRFDPLSMGPFWKARFGNILEKIALQGSCQFDGELLLDKRNTENVFVAGEIVGHDISLADVEISTFSCGINYEKGNLLLADVALKDWAGRATVDRICFQNVRNEWEVFADHVRLEDLRLSRVRSTFLKKDRKKKPLLRFLCIPSFSLNHFQGKLGRPESFKGTGILEFANVPKKNIFSSLLFLPTEITARIGLDLSTLIPVRGTVIFEIKENKIHLLELKDVFSDGKRSRFYLADHSPAYVDFAGKMNMKIKMKQYNLLMKLAEFFTISVKGTLLKPTYTFSNHIDDEEGR